MIEKIRGIQNPLTIIAIFACLAEIAGTVAMATVSKELQSTFVWFVMGFPTLLVVLFFATWNFNSKVLYAPSDFQSDEKFLEMQRLHIGKPGKQALGIRRVYERLLADVIEPDPLKVASAIKTLRRILILAGYQHDSNASANDLLALFQKAMSDTDPDLDPTGDKLKALNSAVAIAGLNPPGGSQW
jgi:hypothetical protein